MDSKHLLSAGEGGVIRLWDWDKLVNLSSEQQILTKVSPKLELQQEGSIFEINGLWVDNQTPGLIYSACGDNNAYCWNLDTGTCVGTFRGHTDYIHCITQRPSGHVVTGSEDGTVRLWDARSYKIVNKIEPFSFEKSSHKWISCMAIDKSDNWLVCGGGSRSLVVWHLPAMTATAFMPTSGTPQALTFTPDDTLVSVGNEQYVYHWEKSGKLIKRVASNSRSLFSVAVNLPVENRVLAVSGTSPLVDVFTTLGNIAFSLQFTNNNRV